MKFLEKLRNKKADSMDYLSSMVIGLVTVGIVLAVGFLIMSNVRSNATVAADVNASTAVNQTISAMSTIPGWLPIVVIVMIGSLLIGLILVFRQKA